MPPQRLVVVTWSVLAGGRRRAAVVAQVPANQARRTVRRRGRAAFDHVYGRIPRLERLISLRVGGRLRIVVVFIWTIEPTACPKPSLSVILINVLHPLPDIPFGFSATWRSWIQPESGRAQAAHGGSNVTLRSARRGIRLVDAGIVHPTSKAKRNRVWLVTDVISAIEAFMERSKRHPAQ